MSKLCRSKLCVPVLPVKFAYALEIQIKLPLLWFLINTL